MSLTSRDSFPPREWRRRAALPFGSRQSFKFQAYRAQTARRPEIQLESARVRSGRLGGVLVIVLLNPAAGGGDPPKTDNAQLFGAAGSKGVIVELRRGQDPAEAARAASARTSIVVAAGGDGTVSAVAAGLV